MQSFDGGAVQNETFYKQHRSLQIFCRLQSYNDNNNFTTPQA